LWARRPGFPTLVKIILEQQVSLASAASMFARMKRNIVPFRPARMIELGEVHLKSLGLTRQKTAYCLHLAQSLADKRLRLSQLSRMSDAKAKVALMEIKGLGAWSADVYLLMALRRPDVWPVNDLA
jgi:DNA-3-methyladenine glycosylase II